MTSIYSSPSHLSQNLNNPMLYHRSYRYRQHLFVPAVVLALALTLPASFVAHAQSEIPPSSDRAPDAISPAPVETQPGARSLDLLEELGLSDEQLLEIMSLRREARANRRGKREALRQAQQQLEQLLAGTASAEEVRSQFEQVQELRQQIATEQFENLMAIREVLEPEQRSLLQERMGHRRNRWRSGRGRWYRDRWNQRGLRDRQGDNGPSEPGLVDE